MVERKRKRARERRVREKERERERVCDRMTFLDMLPIIVKKFFNFLKKRKKKN